MTRLSRCGPTAGRRSPFSDVTGLSTAPSSSAMSSPSLCFRRSPPASYRLMARAMAIGGDRALSGCPSGSGFSTVGLAFILTSSSLMSVLQPAISSGGPRLPSSSSVPRPASLRCRSLACSSFRFSSPATCRSRPSCLSPRTEVGRRSAMGLFFWACWHWDCPTESHRVFSCVPAPLATLAAPPWLTRHIPPSANSMILSASPSLNPRITPAERDQAGTVAVFCLVGGLVVGSGVSFAVARAAGLGGGQ